MENNKGKEKKTYENGKMCRKRMSNEKSENKEIRNKAQQNSFGAYLHNIFWIFPFFMVSTFFFRMTLCQEMRLGILSPHFTNSFIICFSIRFI